MTWTVKNNGFLGLYRGLAPTLIGSIPKAGIRFSLNSEFKGRLKDEQGKLTPAKNFVAGLGAGVCEALIIVAPVETVKTKCIDLNMPFLTGMKHILKNEGAAGIYQGAGGKFDAECHLLYLYASRRLTTRAYPPLSLLFPRFPFPSLPYP